MNADENLPDPSKNNRPVSATRQERRTIENGDSIKRPNDGSIDTPPPEKKPRKTKDDLMITREQMKEQQNDYSDTLTCLNLAPRTKLQKLEEQSKNVLMEETIQFMRNPELRNMCKQALKFHPTKMSLNQSHTINDSSMQDDDTKKQYQKLLSIPHDGEARIRHLPEPTDINCCIFCGHVTGTKYKEQFKQLQESQNTDLEDKLINCEASDCSYKFHISCITFEYPLYQFNVLYLVQEYTTGKLQCPAHYCEACFTQGLQQTANRKDGEWTKVKGQIRVFHSWCAPLHEKFPGEPNTIILLERKAFTEPPPRAQCCVACGRREELENGKEISFAPDYNLVGCETCVHMFHPNCHGTKQKGQKTRCEDCLNNTPIRKQDRVLIHKKEAGIFCAAKIIGVGKHSMIKYRFLSDDAKKIRWTDYNHLIRIYPVLTQAFYHTMKKIYSKHTCSVEKCNTHQIELSLLAKHMKQQFFSDHFIQRPAPVFETDYVFDDGFRAKFPGNYRPPVPYKEIEGLVVPYNRKEGYTVRTTSKIPGNTRIGEYIGRIISDEKLKSMGELAWVSTDKEAKFYNFESKVEVESEVFKCGIDASVHRNKMSLINHSCAPNCIVKPEWYKLGDGLRMERMVVWSMKDGIQAGKQLHICYKWKGMKAFCYCKKCGGERELIFKYQEMDGCQRMKRS